MNSHRRNSFRVGYILPGIVNGMELASKIHNNFLYYRPDW